MKYKKDSLTFEEQADLIISRGLIVDDKERLVSILHSVNYYRLSAYWYPFKQDNESLQPNITLEKIWKRYTFDRQLRLLVMDAIERVEIAVRTLMVNAFVLEHGAFGYLYKENFSNKFRNHSDLVVQIYRNTDRSNEEFVKHYQNKYNEEVHLPLWMAAELMTFGNMFTMFKNIDRNMRIELAQHYNLSAKVLESWLKTLNYIRNLCAHHARLWNRELAIKPILPDKKNHEEWYNPVKIPNHRIFSVLTLLKYMLSYVAPHSKWQLRLEALLENYNDIPLIPMGFPENWKESPIWKNEEVSH